MADNTAHRDTESGQSFCLSIMISGYLIQRRNQLSDSVFEKIAVVESKWKMTVTNRTVFA